MALGLELLAKGLEDRSAKVARRAASAATNWAARKR